jgi:hypothetical protein
MPRLCTRSHSCDALLAAVNDPSDPPSLGIDGELPTLAIGNPEKADHGHLRL